MTKLKYFFYCLFNYFQKKECPYCKSTNLKLIDTKYFFSRLFSCNECALQHRHPKDSEIKNLNFYNNEYEIDTYLITDLPNESNLKKLLDENFSKYADFRKYLDRLKGFRKEHDLVLDFGCSWGYNVKKLNNFGYNSIGLELSKPRARFGEENLGVKIYTDLNSVPKDLNVILSSHVIEHLFDINDYLRLSRSKLDINGYLLTFSPNGDLKFRLRNQDMWRINWGNIHPNHLTVDFYKNIFSKNPYLIMTGDWNYNLDLISNWDGLSQVIGDKLDGMELFVISRPNIFI
jgi:hypothetical protein